MDGLIPTPADMIEKVPRKTPVVREDRSAEVMYRNALMTIVRELQADIKENLLPVIESAARESDYTQDATPFSVIDYIKGMMERWDNAVVHRFAQTRADEFTNQANDTNQKRFARQMAAMGVPVYSTVKGIGEYLRLAGEDAANLIVSIPQQQLAKVQQMVTTNMRQGLRSTQLIPEIESMLSSEFKKRKGWAKFVARDQTAKINSELSRKRQKAAGFEYFQWLDSSDSRVRHSHERITDKVTKYGKGVYTWENLPVNERGERIAPGTDYQCFPSDSKINVFAGATKLYRHWYTGELAEFVTDSGVTFSSTANHPVLTDRGYIAACDINIGDNIIEVPDQAFSVGNGNTESSDVEIGKLFDTFNLAFDFGESIGALGSDFHGDLTNEEINVISLDWSLPDIANTSGVKEFFKLFFSSADKVIVLDLLPSFGDIAPVFYGVTGSSDGSVGGACKLFTLACAGFTHSGVHSLASIGLLYSSLIENSSDDVARDLEFFSDCFNAEIPIEKRSYLLKRYILSITGNYFGLGDYEAPSAEAFTEVVGVTPENLGGGRKGIPLAYNSSRVIKKTIGKLFTGHVYNLEMKNGLYVAHSIAVSNCRCVARPVTQIEVERNKKNGNVGKDSN